jgi:hypothetical protein
MTEPQLTAEQEAEAQQIFRDIQQAYLDQALALARLLASKPNDQLLGQTEFDVRDALHRLGAQTFQAALAGRKKGGTRAPA